MSVSIPRSGVEREQQSLETRCPKRNTPSVAFANTVKTLPLEKNKKMQVGDIIVALDDTDEGFTEGQVCLIHSVTVDDFSDYDHWDVHLLKAWTDTHAYFGKPGLGHEHAATRIEETDCFKVIGHASVTGELGIVEMNENMKEALS